MIAFVLTPFPWRLHNSQKQAMPEYDFETDYLVVGAGAMGIAFADEILHRDSQAHVTLVDRRSKPGGHWNNAYSFVTLHQPALYYGVNSESLGRGGQDLVSKVQILGYFERVLDKLQKTGRFAFLSQSEYLGDGRVQSLVVKERSQTLRIRRRLVDATYSQVTIPSTSPPPFDVEDDVTIVPINALDSLDRPWNHYTVIGAGKTGLDALLFLLSQGVSPQDISWVVSQDSWLVIRESILPQNLPATFSHQLKLCSTLSNATELFYHMEQLGLFFRIDPNIEPTSYRCATVSMEELTKLRSLTNVIRLGRVKSITHPTMHLEHGSVDVMPDTLFINAAANGLAKRPARPVFEPDRITLQPVTHCQPTFGAAVIAHAEWRLPDDETKNSVTCPVPHPTVPEDMPIALHTMFHNLKNFTLPMLGSVNRMRLNAMNHVGFLDNLKLLWSYIRWQSQFFANMQTFFPLEKPQQAATKESESTDNSSASS